MKLPKQFFIFLLGVVALLAYTGIYTVSEGQQAIRLRLGEIVKDAHTREAAVSTPGLHFKTPIVEQVRHFDVRLQTFDVKSSRILTKEQKYVLVDYFVKWRIKDLSLYYKRTGGYAMQAETLLQQKINNGLRAAFGLRTITEVVSGERGSIMALLKNEADAGAKGLGISVIDVRIKRIDLPKEVSASVFKRMRTEREQVATKHRSDGRKAAEILQADADASVTVLLATAKAEAAHTRAKGDAIAARKYAQAYQQDAGFYAFYRSMLAYQHTFKDNDLLVLRPKGEFFRYFLAKTN